MLVMAFRIALRALARNKLRSFLTMLGIIIGVGAVIAMVAIGEGAKKKVQEQIASLGTNLLVILPGTVTLGGARTGSGGRQTLVASDANGGAGRPRHGMRPVSQLFDLFANSAHLFFGGLRLHDDQHKFTLGTHRVGTAALGCPVERSSTGLIRCAIPQDAALGFATLSPEVFLCETLCPLWFKFF